jgi:conjugal transfer mating pair stabilization protein TraG
MTMATMAGIDSVNQNMETLAGYLLMFVPVMAAGMAKAPCHRLQHHRHAGARDARGRGCRRRADHRQLCLWQQPVPERDRPSGQHRAHLECGGQPDPAGQHARDNGTITSTMADGSTVYNTSGAISRFGFSASEMQSVTGNLQQTARNITRAPTPCAKPRPSAGAMGCAPSTASRPARAVRAVAKGGQGGNTTTSPIARAPIPSSRPAPTARSVRT